MQHKKTLAGATIEALLWLQEVIGLFRRTDSRGTYIAIGAVVGSRIASIIAFILPLKVILLVGSQGIPRYFQSFISPDTREQWIVALSIGAVALYVISLGLEQLAQRYALIGSSKVLREANQLAVIRNQDAAAHGYYFRFCSVYANLLFACVLLVAGLALHVWLFTFVGGILAFEVVMSIVLLGPLDGSRRTSVGRYIAGSTTGYLAILSSINFLFVFGFLLADFLVFQRGNVLIALLSIIISRQLFSNLSQFCSHLVGLTREKNRINTLISKDHKFHSPEAMENQQFRKHFEGPGRVARVAELLDASDDRVVSRWCDKSASGLVTFDLQVGSATGLQKHYSEIVYFPSTAYLVDNEDVLFEHVDAQLLRCPPLIDQYSVEGFIGRIFDGGTGRRLPVREWTEVRKDAVVYYWGVEPSQTLSDLYRASKPLLHERLTPDLLERLAIAADDPAERWWLKRAYSELDDLCQLLKDMPHFIHNPELSAETVIEMPDQRLFVLRWGRWSLEPVGVGLEPNPTTVEWLAGQYDELVERGLVSHQVTIDHLLLAARAWTLERLIHRGRYRAAMDLLAEILPGEGAGRGATHHPLVAVK